MFTPEQKSKVMAWLRSHELQYRCGSLEHAIDDALVGMQTVTKDGAVTPTEGGAVLVMVTCDACARVQFFNGCRVL